MSPLNGKFQVIDNVGRNCVQVHVEAYYLTTVLYLFMCFY